MAKQIAPNVIRGGQAIPLGNNFYYMRGRKHSQGGIDIGKDLEVEGGEVMQMGGKTVKVYSSLPFLNGQSPAQRVIKGEDPDLVFNAQEKFKKVNKINDDGTRKKAEWGEKLKKVDGKELAWDVVKLIDPTGISSWKDVGRSIKYFVNRPNIDTGLGAAVNILGAIPVIGKFGKIGKAVKFVGKLNKLTKSGSKTQKVLKTVGKVGKTIEHTNNINNNVKKVSKAIRYATKSPQIAYDIDMVLNGGDITKSIASHVAKHSNGAFFGYNPRSNDFETGKHKEKYNGTINPAKGNLNNDDANIPNLTNAVIYGDISKLKKGNPITLNGKTNDTYEFPLYPHDTLTIDSTDNKKFNNSIVPLDLDRLVGNKNYNTNLMDAQHYSVKINDNNAKFFDQLDYNDGLLGSMMKAASRPTYKYPNAGFKIFTQTVPLKVDNDNPDKAFRTIRFPVNLKERVNETIFRRNLYNDNNKKQFGGNMKRQYKIGGTYTITANGRTNLRFITSTGKRVQARTGSIQRQIEERNLAISQAHARNKAARNAVKGNLKSFIKTPKLKYLGRAISSAYKGYIAPEHPEVQGGIAPTPGISKVRPKQILNVRSILNNVRGHVKNLNVKGTSAIREGLNTADKWAKSTRQQLVNAINQDVTNIKDNTLKAKALASQRAAYRELMKRKAAAVENSQTQAINAGRNSSATINTKNMTDAQLRSFIGEDNSLLTGRQQGQAARDVYAARQELNAREAAAKVKQARLDKAKATRDANRKAAEEEAARKAQANADRAAKAKATREAHKVAAENAKYEAELAAKERATKASFTKAQKKAASSNSSTFEHNGSTYFTDSGNEVTGYKLGVGEANYNEAIKNGWSDYENGWGRISSISEKPSFESYGRAGTVSHTKPQSTSLWQRGKNNVHEWSARRKANSYNTKAEQQGHNVRMTTDGKGNTSFTTKEELAARNQPATNQTSATTGNSGNNSSATGDNPPTSPTQPTRWRDRHSVFGYPIRHPWKTVTGAGVIGAGITGIIKVNSTPNATLPAQSSGPAVQHDYEDNTRRRYDTGSSMDANKFGGKRKHRVGGQLRGNDFFRQSPTRKVTSGDRKKALVGTETWRDELAKPVKGIEYKDYKPSWSGIRLAGVNIDGTVLNQRDLKPLELSPTISKGQARRIKIGNIWNNITNGITLNDAIGAGANLIGSGISAYINHRTNNRMKAPSAPMPLSAQKLKTTYNINPQLDAINEQVGNTIRDTNSNTASSNVALQRANAARLAGMQAKNTLYATKENKEAELINTDRLNKQSVVKNNVTNYNAWRDKVTDFNNAKNQTRADINNSLVNNINSVVQNLITRRERRKFDENNLIATMMAYPNVNPDMLLAMGLIDKEQAEMIKLGRKKPTNTND